MLDSATIPAVNSWKWYVKFGKLVFGDVLYLPSLRFSLFSVYKFLKDEIWNKIVVQISQSKTVLKGKLVSSINHLYRFISLKEHLWEKFNHSEECRDDKSSEIDNWHIWHGHFSIKALKALGFRAKIQASSVYPQTTKYDQRFQRRLKYSDNYCFEFIPIFTDQ